MPQPNELTEVYKGFNITTDKVKINITKGDSTVYHRESRDHVQVCAATHLQCAKVWIDGHC